MLAFHIDWNMAQHRVEYLRQWLPRLAAAGYDAVLWEMENGVAWETCPECVAPDALDKATFRSILDEARALGLESIPLLQTIGHAEYVLRHEPYAPLRELPDKIDQYCPRNPEVLPFLDRWIREVVDLFGAPGRFHIGADEAWHLGSCESCQAFCEEHSSSRLYVDHVNAVARPLLEAGIRPMIWADMVLHHHEALDRLDRRFMLCDWNYSSYEHCGYARVWGEGDRRPETMPRAFLERFGAYVWPRGDEPGRLPDPFYATDFLIDQGFETLTCPSVSHYGDNAFSPRTYLHLANTRGQVRRALKRGAAGSIQTSWSVHIFPWELQLPGIELAGALRKDPDLDIDAFEERYARETFGLEGRALFDAMGLLSKSCLFTNTATMGFGKSLPPVNRGWARERVAALGEADGIVAARENVAARRSEYEEAIERFESLAGQARRGSDLLAIWLLAARNLRSRAEVSAFLLDHAEALLAEQPLAGVDRQRAGALRGEQDALLRETQALYEPMIRPDRRERLVAYLFEPWLAALASLSGR